MKITIRIKLTLFLTEVEDEGLLLVVAILIITSNVAYRPRGDRIGALELTWILKGSLVVENVGFQRTTNTTAMVNNPDGIIQAVL